MSAGCAVIMNFASRLISCWYGYQEIIYTMEMLQIRVLNVPFPEKLVGNHLPAHCWWMFLSLDFCFPYDLIQAYIFDRIITKLTSPLHCSPSDDAWFQFIPEPGIVSNLDCLVQVVSVRSLHCKSTHSIPAPSVINKYIWRSYFLFHFFTFSFFSNSLSFI